MMRPRPPKGPTSETPGGGYPASLPLYPCSGVGRKLVTDCPTNSFHIFSHLGNRGTTRHHASTAIPIFRIVLLARVKASGVDLMINGEKASQRQKDVPTSETRSFCQQ